MKRVVVAGGAGFIGSHLCDALIERGDEVVCLDDLSTGSRSNVSHLQAEARFTLMVADVVHELPVIGPVDAVCNLASPASPPEYLRRPFATLAVGSEGARRLVELAADHGARYLLASTSEVYGNPLEHPQTEAYRGNVEATGPRSVYDEAKRFAEAQAMAWHRHGRVDVGIARIFNTYGPRLAAGDGRVVSNFVTQALDGRPLTVYGDGLQTRSFCFIDDQVRGLLALLDAAVTGPVNIGMPDERTMRELADLVIGLTGSASEVVFEPLPEDDPVRRCPDISLAGELLGWKPTVPLEEGLARTIEHFARFKERGPEAS